MNSRRGGRLGASKIGFLVHCRARESGVEQSHEINFVKKFNVAGATTKASYRFSINTCFGEDSLSKSHRSYCTDTPERADTAVGVTILEALLVKKGSTSIEIPPVLKECKTPGIEAADIDPVISHANLLISLSFLKSFESERTIPSSKKIINGQIARLLAFLDNKFRTYGRSFKPKT
ncbi:hypothetical protein CIP107555_01926 [Corynebacterium diphtheriae]|nr:hypothetical protein CIP107555_01926 [Corynebacterium diphtheriae]